MACKAASAQLATDQVPRGRTVPAEEALKQEVGQARYRLGPFRILPKLIVSNAGYDNNVFGTPRDCAQTPGCNETKTADWTATVLAGARFVAPLGAKMYIAGDALPQYNWYRQLSSRRTLGGLYRGSLFGFFNRMSLEAKGFSSKTFSPLNSETETRIVESATDGSANLEVDISRVFSAFAGAEVRRARLSLGGQVPALRVDVKLLDRDDEVARTGLRCRISPQWDVTLGVEGTRALFVESPEKQNNQTLAYVLGIHYNRPRLFVNLSGGRREGRGYRSIFPRYSTTIYSYFASFFLTRKVEIQGFGQRGVPYGSPLPGNLAFSNLFFVETRNGGGINLEIISHLLVRAQAEYGTNDFPAPVLIGDTFRKRTDKVSTLTGGFSALLYKKIVLTALASQQKYDSPVPGVRRTVERFTTALSFEGELAR